MRSPPMPCMLTCLSVRLKAQRPCALRFRQFFHPGVVHKTRSRCHHQEIKAHTGWSECRNAHRPAGDDFDVVSDRNWAMKRGTASGSSFCLRRLCESESMQVEVYVDQYLHRHWMSLVHSRPEPVLLYSFDGLFVQPHAEMTNQADVLRIPLRIDNQLDRNISLIIRPARVICELRLDGIDDLRCAYASAHAHQAATVAPTAARARSNATPRANAAAKPLTES